MMRQCKREFSRSKQKERARERERGKKKPTDDLMDCTNLKANMVLIHAVCVRPRAPARCLGEKDFCSDILSLAGTSEGLRAGLGLGRDVLAALRS